MNSQQTRFIITSMTKLLESALKANNHDLIRQYTWGLFFAKSTHIQVLEKELLTQSAARKAA